MAIRTVGQVRHIMNLTSEEEELLRVCRRLTGLDKCRTIRYLMRRGAVAEILKYRNDGGVKLPEDLQKFVDEYFTDGVRDA